MNWRVGVQVAADFVRIPVGLVHKVVRNVVPLLDQRIEDVSKDFIAVPVARLHAAILIVKVVKLNSTTNGLGQGEAGGPGSCTTEFSPQLRSHVLGCQAVLGPDGGKPKIVAFIN